MAGSLIKNPGGGLALSGGSNGGLLVGATMTLEPGLANFAKYMVWYLKK